MTRISVTREEIIMYRTLGSAEVCTATGSVPATVSGLTT
jgi:hypothetical protein